ncbi:unnamed protein product, partial [Oncorhynchus mykiss]
CFLSPGAWITATDLPEIIGNLRANLLRNTRGRCRNTPQAAALSWGPDVERIYPRSVYRYDYVLAADVVYHHDYLEELLFTMRYFCRPGTTLIWANKVRLKTDLSFTENFQNTFNTTLLAEIGEVNIFMGTCRETEEKPELDPGKQQEEEEEPELVPGKQQEEEEEEHVCLQVEGNGLEEKEEEFEADQTTENEEENAMQKEGLKEENKDRENQEDSQDCRDDEEQQNSAGSRSTSESELEGLEEADTQDSNVQREERPVWVEQFVTLRTQMSNGRRDRSGSNSLLWRQTLRTQMSNGRRDRSGSNSLQTLRTQMSNGRRDRSGSNSLLWRQTLRTQMSNGRRDRSGLNSLLWRQIKGQRNKTTVWRRRRKLMQVMAVAKHGRNRRWNIVMKDMRMMMMMTQKTLTPAVAPKRLTKTLSRSWTPRKPRIQEMPSWIIPTSPGYDWTERSTSMLGTKSTLLRQWTPMAE